MTALSESLIADRLLSALVAARGRGPAEAAIAGVREQTGASPHAMRYALDHVQRDPDANRAFVWPTIETVRETVESLDAAIDRALIASVAGAPLSALARDLEASGSDRSRAIRSLDIVWKHLAPPTARATAALIDLLRASALGPARLETYRYLVARGADIRSPLADDIELDARDRTTALCELAAHHKAAGRTRTLDWSRDPTATLARAVADWTLFATHPRQLLFWYRRWAGVSDEAYPRVLTEVAHWPLSLEVRAQVDCEASRQPQRVQARSVGSGRYECGGCGSLRVSAVRRRFVDEQDPVRGVATEYACYTCDMTYVTAWECANHDRLSTSVPQGWAPGVPPTD